MFTLLSFALSDVTFVGPRQILNLINNTKRIGLPWQKDGRDSKQVFHAAIHKKVIVIYMIYCILA